MRQGQSKGQAKIKEIGTLKLGWGNQRQGDMSYAKQGKSKGNVNKKGTQRDMAQEKKLRKQAYHITGF